MQGVVKPVDLPPQFFDFSRCGVAGDTDGGSPCGLVIDGQQLSQKDMANPPCVSTRKARRAGTFAPPQCGFLASFLGPVTTRFRELPLVAKPKRNFRSASAKGLILGSSVG
jgi:hypothetical protein